jgi:hypothetical protein
MAADSTAKHSQEDEGKYQELRTIIRETLDLVRPEDSSHTTRWSQSFESREELEEWLRQHRVSQASLDRALTEYDISLQNSTPKKFVITGKRGRGRFVQVFGRRRRDRPDHTEGDEAGTP